MSKKTEMYQNTFANNARRHFKIEKKMHKPCMFNTRLSNARHHLKQNKMRKLCSILVETKIT